MKRALDRAGNGTHRHHAIDEVAITKSSQMRSMPAILMSDGSHGKRMALPIARLLQAAKLG